MQTIKLFTGQAFSKKVCITEETRAKKGHLTPERSGLSMYETGLLQSVPQLCFMM